MADAQGPTERRPVNPLLDRLGAYSWRLIGVGIVALALLWLLGRLRVVVIPIVIAVFLTRILTPIATWLRGHRWRPAVAAAVTLLAAFVLTAGLSAAIASPLADEAATLGPTMTQAVDDIEKWLVDDGPFDISRRTVDRFRQQAGDRVEDVLRMPDGAIVGGATIAAEVVASLFLSLLLTFFLLSDGDRFAAWTLRRISSDRRETVRRAGDRAWSTIGGYLRGAALLGVVEAALIGITLAVAGGGLVAPVMALTFVAAFVPIVGAIVAGVIAVMVALVTGGLGTGVAVAVVAIIVQQLDNDLLSPVIFGRALNLHPAVVLLSVTGGGALFGIPGAILAVPIVAVMVNVFQEVRSSDVNHVNRARIS